MERVKNMKKPAMAVLAAALIMAVTVMGTLAYLTASQGSDKAVANTFIAAKRRSSDRSRCAGSQAARRS